MHEPSGSIMGGVNILCWCSTIKRPSARTHGDPGKAVLVALLEGHTLQVACARLCRRELHSAIRGW